MEGQIQAGAPGGAPQVAPQTLDTLVNPVATGRGAFPAETVALLRDLLAALEQGALVSDPGPVTPLDNPQPARIEPETTLPPPVAAPIPVACLPAPAPVADIPAVAAQLLCQAAPRLKSSRLWSMIGGVITLAGQNLAGLDLSPPAQLAIAGIVMTYIAFRSMQGGR